MRTRKRNIHMRLVENGVKSQVSVSWAWHRRGYACTTVLSNGRSVTWCHTHAYIRSGNENRTFRPRPLLNSWCLSFYSRTHAARIKKLLCFQTVEDMWVHTYECNQACQMCICTCENRNYFQAVVHTYVSSNDAVVLLLSQACCIG